MSSLAVGFAPRIRKRAASAQGETTPGSEVSSGKRPNRSGLNEGGSEELNSNYCELSKKSL